jgi:hypothetical protein
MLAARERCESSPWRYRKVDSEGRGGDRNGLPVPAGVGQEQQYVIKAAITELEHHSAKLSLPIDQARVCIDRQALRNTSQPIDEPIPCPLVAGYRQRHLGPEAKVWVQPLAQPAEKGDLSRIEDGIRSWIDADADVQADRRTDTGELID